MLSEEKVKKIYKSDLELLRGVVCIGRYDGVNADPLIDNYVDSIECVGKVLEYSNKKVHQDIADATGVKYDPDGGIIDGINGGTVSTHG